MKLAKIQDEIARSVGGNKETQGSIMDPKFISAAIISYRAEIAYRNYKRDRGLSDIYYQDIPLILDEDFQVNAPDCDSVVFEIPAFIKLGEYDGVLYCGGIDGQSPWLRVKDMGQLGRLQNNPITKFKNNPGEVYFLPLYMQNMVVVWNRPTLVEGKIRGVVNDPTKVKEFNKDEDEYPIDEGDVVELIELIKRDIIQNKAFKPNIEWNQPTGQAENPFKERFLQQPQQ